MNVVICRRIIGSAVSRAALLSFLLLLASGGALAATQYERTMTVSGYDGTETLTNFPVAVRISSANGFDYGDFAARGADIRFKLSDGTVLRHEVDEWNTDGESVAWVLLPEMKQGTSFVMCWGDPSATEPVSQTDGSVWRTAGYVSVWHGAEAKGDVRDSGGKGHHFRALGDIASSVATNGMIGSSRANALGSAGSTVLVADHNEEFAARSKFALSFWLRGSEKYNGSTSTSRPLCKRIVHTGSNGWEFDDNNFRYNDKYFSSGLNVSATDNVWRHFVISVDDTSFVAYQNGVIMKTATLEAPINDGAYPLTLGGGNIGDYKGLRSCWDEVRYRSAAVSADWVKAEYESVAVANFVTMGDVFEANNDLTVAAITPTPEVAFVPVHTYYVATTGDDAADGSKATPVKSLSRALELAGDGDLVRILAGDHTEMVPSVNPSIATFAALGVVTNAVHIQGDGEANTILHCRRLSTSGDGIYPQGFYINNAKAVVSDLAVVDHFSVSTKDSVSDRGSAFQLADGLVTRCRVTASGASGDFSFCSVVIGPAGVMTDSFVTNNTVTRYCKGNPVRVFGGTMRRCVIADNRGGQSTATLSDGVALVDGGRLEDCVIYGNRKNQSSENAYGGGVYASGGIVERCLVFGHTNTYSGAAGGVYLAGSALLRNSLVTANRADAGSTSAGGVSCNGRAQVRHCTIAGNLSGAGAGGLRLGDGRVYGVIAYGNESSSVAGDLSCDETKVYGSCFPAATGLNDNLAVSPIFENVGEPLPRLVSGLATLTAYTISGASPARNAAKFGWNAVEDDLHGDARPAYGLAGKDYPDMGCYEVTGTSAGAVIDPPTPVAKGENIILTAKPTLDDTEITHTSWTLTKGEESKTYEVDGAVLTVTPSDPIYGCGSYDISLTALFGTVSAPYALKDVVLVKPLRVYVATDGLDSFPYDTPETAARNLSVAVETVGYTDAEPGEVIVADGTYDGMKTMTAEGVMDVLATLAKPIRLVGNNADPTKVVFKYATDTIGGGIHVADARAVACGFTVSGTAKFNPPSGESYSDPRGQSLHVKDGTVSNVIVTASHCAGGFSQPLFTQYDGLSTHVTVTNNNMDTTAYYYIAGAVYVTGGTVEDLEVSGNQLADVNLSPSAMLLVDGKNAIVRNARVTDNWTGCRSHSGQVSAGVVTVVKGVLENAVVTGNTCYSPEAYAAFYGGIWQKGGKVRNCLVAENVVVDPSKSVGGVKVDGGTMVNCTVTGNSMSNVVSGCYAGAQVGSSGRLANTIVWNNVGATDENSGVDAEKGNLTGVDPLFAASRACRYVPKLLSPAVNRGLNAEWNGEVLSTATDLIGNPRLHRKTIDIGCYENQECPGLLILVR